MKLYKMILFILLVIFIAMQAVQPVHNISGQVLPTDISKSLNVPNNVFNIFKNSCYDCHSNNTRYPWYVNIQPVGGIMSNHIKIGKENLNFSDFGAYSLRKKANKLRAIKTSVEEGSMPLPAYLIMHGSAKLSEEDKKTISEWVSTAKDSLVKNK